MNAVTALKPTNGGLSWWQDKNMVALVRRTAAKDCNADEFDEFVAVSRDLKLNPLRKQIYAFVFSRDDPKKRNMVIVVGIDGMRAISAGNGLYRPDNKPPRWTIDEKAVNADTNPIGIVSCEVSIFIGNKLRGADGGETIEWNEVVGAAYWDEFAPILKVGDEDDYEMIDTGEVWPDSGKPKKRRKLKAGAELRYMLDPKKDGWRKSGRHMIAKCAEAIAHRKANPEPLSRVYSDEEIDRARTIEVEYADLGLTPSEMAAKGEADQRLERIGGPAIMAVADDSGVLDRVPVGQFADWCVDKTKDMSPEQVATFMARNRVALQEFWGHNKTDALELKKVLEARTGAARPASTMKQPAADQPTGGPAADKLRADLLADIARLRTPSDFTVWARDAAPLLAKLPQSMRAEVEAALARRQESAA